MARIFARKAFKNHSIFKIVIKNSEANKNQFTRKPSIHTISKTTKRKNKKSIQPKIHIMTK